MSSLKSSFTEIPSNTNIRSTQKRNKTGKKCSHAGCTNNAKSRGLCKRHGGGLRCNVEGCTTSARPGGRCIAHGGGLCKEKNCTTGARSGGMCLMHYRIKEIRERRGVAHSPITDTEEMVVAGASWVKKPMPSLKRKRESTSFKIIEKSSKQIQKYQETHEECSNTFIFNPDTIVPISFKSPEDTVKPADLIYFQRDSLSIDDVDKAMVGSNAMVNSSPIRAYSSSKQHACPRSSLIASHSSDHGPGAEICFVTSELSEIDEYFRHTFDERFGYGPHLGKATYDSRCDPLPIMFPSSLEFGKY